MGFNAYIMSQFVRSWSDSTLMSYLSSSGYKLNTTARSDDWREKGRDPTWLYIYDKIPFTIRKKSQGTTEKRHQNFDNTTIAD